MSTAQEYAAVREAIQLLTTLDADGARRDTVSVSADGMTTTYAHNQLSYLQKREEALARRLSVRNARKRVVSSFGGGRSYPGA